MDKIILFSLPEWRDDRLENVNARLRLTGEEVPLENDVTDEIGLRRSLIYWRTEERNSVNFRPLKIRPANSERFVFSRQHSAIELREFFDEE